MARAVPDILEELKSLAPSWLKRDFLDVLLLEALAHALRAGEVAWDGFLSNFYRETATGPWLDALADELDVPRRPGEPDGEYRERLVRHFYRGTVGQTLEDLERLCSRGGRTRYRVEYTEARWRPTGNRQDGFFTDDPQSITVDPEDPKFLGKITIWLPPLLDLGADALYTDCFDGPGAFTDVDAYTLDSPLERDRKDVVLLSEVVKTNRPVGTATLVEFRSSPASADLLLPLFSNEVGIL